MAALSRLQAVPASRYLLITINQWESDTLIRTELTTDVTLSVLDRSGSLIAEENCVSRKALGGDFMSPILHARKSVLAETSQILHSLLTSPKIEAALR